MTTDMKAITALLHDQMPDFIRAVTSQENGGSLIMSQDAFPKLDEAELYLLGAAIKYAGSKGVTVTIAAPDRP
jgi:hypothetical protein